MAAATAVTTQAPAAPAPVPLPHAPESTISRALRRSADRLANLCQQLAERPKDSQLLGSLLQASCEVPEPLRRQLTPVLEQLRRLRLETSAFVLMAVIGQELLASGCADEAVSALESALRVGSCSLKLRGSVLSALSRAHWAVGSFDEGLDCMRQDLEIARELGDEAGECRALANLGAAHLSRGDLTQALEKHEAQLQLATRLHDQESAMAALTALGHVYTIQGDFRQALFSHRQCALLCRQLGNKLEEAHQVGCMGTVYTALQELDAALDCHRVHLRVAEAAGNAEERCRALCNLGSALLVRADYNAAVDNFHIALQMIHSAPPDHNTASWRATMEERAHAGLGHAARQQGDYEAARKHHEAQLDCALQAKDRAGEARAASNLGIICQHLGHYEAAVALHKQHLRLAKALGDQAGAGRAYGNLGNGYSALGQYELAIRCHSRELSISHQVGDRVAESATHGNLAVAHQALGEFQTALHHYCLHLDSARELRDSASELRALNNLGNFHCSRSQYELALDYYIQGIAVARQNADVGAEAAVQHRLGFAFYQLARYAESAHHYERDLELHLRMEDIGSAARAHCNLGLALKQVGELARALEHQASFLRLTIELGHVEGHFKALGNLADVHLAQGAKALSADMYQKQLALAESSGSDQLRALAHENLAVVASLAVASRSTDELIHREMALKLWRVADNGCAPECAALGALAKAQLRVGNRDAALASWKEQLNLARRLQLTSLEAEACGGLGRTLLMCGDVEVAVGMLEQHLSLLESETLQSKCYADLADCYSALGDQEQAHRYWERLLTSATAAKHLENMNRALCGISVAERASGRLAEALVATEKRLLVAHEAIRPDWQAAAYGELGCLHGLQNNWIRAVECFQHQLRLARQVGDSLAEAAAACGLGEAAQCRGATAEALEWHQLELRLAECCGEEKIMCRALSNLGLAQEAAGQLAAARATQERLLGQPKCDCVTQVTALTALGRLTLALGEPLVAVDVLQKGLTLAESANLLEEQARLRYRLGLALIAQRRCSEASVHLRNSASILDACRSRDEQVGLWDLQSNVLAALQLLLMRELNEPAQALEQAEKCRSRALLKFLTDRQQKEEQMEHMFSIESLNIAEMTELACQEGIFVLYCSALGSGHLISWLLAPTGVLVFWHCTELPEDSFQMLALAMRLTCSKQKGVQQQDLAPKTTVVNSSYCPEESDFFLKFWNRNEALPSSTSKSTTFDNNSSVEHVADFIYRLIIEPMEPYLPQFVTNSSEPISLLIIPPIELLAIPWALVRPLHGHRKLLCDRFNILLATSLASVRQARLCYEHHERALNERIRTISNQATFSAAALVLGCTNNRFEQDSCRALAELLGVRALLGAEATRSALLADLAGKELLHLNAPLVGAALNLSPPAQSAAVATYSEVSSNRTQSLSRVYGNFEVLELQDDVALEETSSAGRSFSTHSLHEKSRAFITSQETPSSSSFLLSSQNVLHSDLSCARLVLLMASSNNAKSDNLMTDQMQLAHALLAAGAQCVLLRMWQPPEPAVKLFLRTFYGGLLREQSVQRAFGLALRTVRDSPGGFHHPHCWAAWILMGRGGISLRSRSRYLAASIRALLCVPLHNRNTARVCLHLVEKSLQRMGAGLNKPMFTSLSAVRSRCQSSSKIASESALPPLEAIWSTLLAACGFRLEPTENAVFFPASDPADRLSQCSAALQSLLGLNAGVGTALGQLLSNHDMDEHAAIQLIYLLRDAAQSTAGEDGLSKLPVSLALWRIPGCHELLASLGLDLAEVHDEEVIVRCSSTGRQHELVLTTLLAMFKPLEAPRCLPLEPHGSTILSSSKEDFSSVPRGGVAGMSSCGSSGALSKALSLHVGSVAEKISPLMATSFIGSNDLSNDDAFSPASSSADDDELPPSEPISSRQRDYIPLENTPPHPNYLSTPSQSDDEEFGAVNQHQRHKLLVSAAATATVTATSSKSAVQCVPARRTRSKEISTQPANQSFSEVVDTPMTTSKRRTGDSFDHQRESNLLLDGRSSDTTKLFLNDGSSTNNVDHINSDHNLATITEVSDSELSIISSPLGAAMFISCSKNK